MNRLKVDLISAVQEFPGLVIIESDGAIELTGEIDLIDKNTNKFIDTFSVCLTFPARFPFCFPNVYETSNKIERILDRHVFPDGSLCLALPVEEILLCRNGISTPWFIKSILIPRLAEEFRVNNGEKYSRAYDHDVKGLWQFYFKLFNVSDEALVIKILKSIVEKKLPNRNSQCLCSADKKFKLCHGPAIEKISALRNDIIQKQIESLTTQLNK